MRNAIRILLVAAVKDVEPLGIGHYVAKSDLLAARQSVPLLSVRPPGDGR